MAEQDGFRSSDRKALLAVFDKAVEYQWTRAQKGVESLRRRSAHDSDGSVNPDLLAQRVVREFTRDLAVVGGTSGAVAAVPGVGTVARVATGLTLETGVLLERSVYMALAVAHAYGHDLTDVEIRRYAILRVLAVWAGAANGLTSFSGLVGQGLGTKATRAIPMSGIHAVNRAIGKPVLFKWASRTGTIRLGSALPFGIGAGIGATGNYVMAKGLGSAAISEFRPPSWTATGVPR